MSEDAAVIPRILDDGRENDYYFLVKKWLRILENEGVISKSPNANEDELNELTLPESIMTLIAIRFSDELSEFVKKAQKKYGKSKKVNGN